MRETELRSAKKYFKHQVDLEKFKQETFNKLEEHNYYQAPSIDNKRKKQHPKWVLAAVASIMIIGSSLTFGGSHITDAAESMFNQIFGSKQTFQDAFHEEDQEFYSLYEQKLTLAEKTLRDEEFTTYSQLLKEHTEIWTKVRKENREPNSEEAARLQEIKELEMAYESEFALIEAQQMASYTITKPTYIPDGYEHSNESFYIKEKGEEPVVTLHYSNGESVVDTKQLNITQQTDIENAGLFEKPESYSLEGLEFEYVPSNERWPADGMRITVPEKGYKIILTAEELSKEEMEKILLSMIDN